MKKFIFFLTILLVFAASCKRDALCYNHPHYPQIRLDVDLSKTDYTFSDLLSYQAIFYPIDDGVMPIEKLKPLAFELQAASDFYISLAPGRYRLVLYNDYFPENIFLDTDSYDDIYVTTKKPTIAGKSLGDNLSSISEPEPLVVASIDDLLISENMSEEDRVIHLEPEEKTISFDFIVKVKGLIYSKSASGYFGSLCNTHHLTREIEEDSDNKIDFSSAQYYFDRSTSYDGSITIPAIRSLGLKRDANNKVADCIFHLDFLMRDNSICSFDIDLTQYMPTLLEDNNKKTITITIGLDIDPFDPIELPEVKLEFSGSGFSVDVGDWGEEIVIKI